MSDLSDTQSESEEYVGFCPKKIVDHTQRIHMGYNGTAALVFNDSIYVRQNNNNGKKSWKRKYSFNGTREIWCASDIRCNNQPIENQQGFLVFTKDGKYITNIHDDIIEFSLKPCYEIVGFLMKWIKRINDTYDTAFLVQNTTTGKFYFMYVQLSDYGFDANLLKYVNILDKPIINACRNNRFLFCGCEECIDPANNYETYFNLTFFDQYPIKIRKPTFVTDVKIIAEYGH